ncbi:Metal-dependent hydrolase, beta-lactamase superfamily II [Marininema mesophilum]|uniref:Metal-dependent hydrolase, beta-lactamase superfamily II n=1 Tax=Marininema mesophilum TaxID=1048340 RepID=A0A1H3B936_9BACL|nr:ComEC/Rec2 family competence protein [Marininema mesophilum]SDX38141.1 Metal-dependent hydrolase, beta-lactamase superfamily II [Marininema mesophilum]
MQKNKRIVPLFLVAMLVATVMVPFETQAESKKLIVRFIDVGQGDSALIQFPSGKTMLIDGGEKEEGSSLVKKLKKWKIKKIDILVATHPHPDHIGGLISVLSSISVNSVYAPKVSDNTDTYREFLKRVKSKRLTIKTAKANITLSVGKDATAKMIAPVKAYINGRINDWSAVVKVTHGKNSFLFTGDAESKAESDMVNSKQPLTANVLKVAHHGAKSSSTTAFLNKAKPKYAIISVGKNSYGHPDNGVLERLKKAGATVYRTDNKGDIIVSSDQKRVKFSSAR